MYDSKDPLVSARQLRTQRLVLPFKITGNATPASKTVTNDEPAILFTKVEGVNRMTVADGAFDTAAELSALTLATATDTTGIFNLLVRIGEPVQKVISARCYRKGVAAGEIVSCTFPTGATTGITSLGDKIVLNVDSAVDFSAADLDAVLELQYVLTK